MEFAANASRLHKKVGEILASTSPFKGSTLQQEVIVSSLFPEYPNNKDRYDWVIPSMFIIIEAHGIQHYKTQSFGASAEQALMNFQSQQFRDKQKEEIALLNGWTYIIIPYSDEKNITSEYLIDAYSKSYNPSRPIKKKEVVKPDWLLQKEKETRERGKIVRKEQYKRMKEYKNGTKSKFK